jgi:BirA family biotin operon repressor/biotin-[acetyl-CoA-carboxylase] ligase
MTLTQARLETALRPRPVRYLAQVESTNDLARIWLQDGQGSGAVFVADEQIKGRGRMGHGWFAPPGTALMFSVVIVPESVDLVARAAMLGAVVVSELLDSLGIDKVGIKWPNDVQIDGRKVAGILPEAVWEGERLLGLVLGIGLNARIDFGDTDLADKATSIETMLGKSVDRLDLLVDLLGRIDRWVGQPESDLHETWKNRLNMLGQIVTVNQPDGSVRGRAESVDERGALLLRLEDDSVYRAVAGDIAVGT